ncbi:MAG: hypothetical protein HXX08_09845 [Chloroflexi bacterium]|uniref:Uncharacterized protein n=1 Tax=Candidatus Chlorohelix allophototropha TaxID=3003348 RepID=A0A8T7M1S1_9CHLR|nr:hypothetical protein [Chloroflexota bacterium]WJW65546.1 hypothetical protein OZ401_001313 [Chloroflexota bacterium L227-S17]
MKIQKSIILCGFILVQLTLVACSDATTTPLTAAKATSPVNSPIANSPTATLTTLDLQKRWLQGIPCRLPCWEGITPGITTFDEAINLLSKIPRVTNIQFATYFSPVFGPQGKEGEEEVKAATWNWGADIKGGTLLAYPDGEKKIRFINPNYYTNFTLKEAIAFYGELQYIIPYTQMDHVQTYSLEFIFADKGFLLATTATKPLVLEENITLGEFDVYGPTLADLKLMIPIRDEYIQTWKGFKDYDYSCVHVGFLIDDCGKLPAKAP